MLSSAIRAAVAVLISSTLTGLYGQETQLSSPVATVPRLLRITSAFRTAIGLPAAPVESVTLSIYKDDHDLTPLWQETQNVPLDAEGRYTVLMGSSLSDGMPLDLFSAGEPRWLGVQFNRPGETEQPRVLLVSVPYALKAADADTLGGRPASAYLVSPAATARDEKSGAASNKVSKSADTPDAINALTSGTTGAIAKFVNATDLGDSVMHENNGQIGVGTTTPLDKLHVRFTDTSGCCTGYAVQNLGSGAASYSGMLFYDQNGALGQFQGFNNSTHEYRINNIASGGSINFMIGSSSKFLVANNGNVGIGTASPASKLDVAGPVNSTMLSLPATTNPTTGVMTLGGSRFLHAFGNNTFLGTNAGNFLAATNALLNTGIGSTALYSNTTGSDNTATGYGALFLNTTGSSNTATGVHALHLNTTGEFNSATGYYSLYSNTTGNNNTAIGAFALSANTTGYANTATGTSTLISNTTGMSNTATGGAALNLNTTGNSNTANGFFALSRNTTGFSNTALGYFAGVTGISENANTTGSSNAFIGFLAGPGTSTQLRNATAIGANALVSANNTLVLGDPQVSVAIGASTAATKLQVIGDIRVGTSGTNGCIQAFGGAAIAGTCSSDVRLKRKIEPFSPSLHKLIQLQPVSYEWMADEHPEYHFGRERTTGLIAQEVEKLFPEMVATDEHGYKAVNYSQLPLLLLQAVRELKAESDALLEERRQFQSQLDAIKEALGMSSPEIGARLH